MNNEKQQIIITVAGSSGTGKTSIAALLKQQLEIFGFDVWFEDPDGAELPCANTIKKRIDAVQRKGCVIQINEVQTLREAR